jgi:hypothetical protein
VFGKENFTKNIKGKVTVIVNKYDRKAAAIRGKSRIPGSRAARTDLAPTSPGSADGESARIPAAGGAGAGTAGNRL